MQNKIMSNFRLIILSAMFCHAKDNQLAINHMKKNQIHFEHIIHDKFIEESKKYDIPKFTEEIISSNSSIQSVKLLGFILRNIDMSGEKYDVLVMPSDDNDNHTNHYYLIDGLIMFDENKDSYLISEEQLNQIRNHEHKSESEISFLRKLSMQKAIQEGENFDMKSFVESDLLDETFVNNYQNENRSVYKISYEGGSKTNEFYGSMDDLFLTQLILKYEGNNLSELAHKINKAYLVNYNNAIHSSWADGNMIKLIHYYYLAYNVKIEEDSLLSHLNQINYIYFPKKSTGYDIQSISTLFHENKVDTIHEEKLAKLVEYFKGIADQEEAKEVAHNIYKLIFDNFGFYNFGKGFDGFSSIDLDITLEENLSLFTIANELYPLPSVFYATDLTYDRDIINYCTQLPCV